MKTKKFIEEVEKLGFKVIKESSFSYRIVNEDNCTLIEVIKTNKNILNTVWECFKFLNSEAQDKLFDLAVQLAKTPINERKEPKKYYLRNKMISGKCNYLNASKTNIFDTFFNGNFEINNIKTKFTDEEIKKLSQIIKLESFEKIEVTDDE